MTTPVVVKPALIEQLSQRHDNEILSRPHMAQGQLAGITSMYADGRCCREIPGRLTAARAAADAVGLVLLDEHINAYVRDGIGRGRSDGNVAALVTTVRRFVRSR